MKLNFDRYRVADHRWCKYANPDDCPSLIALGSLSQRRRFSTELSKVRLGCFHAADYRPASKNTSPCLRKHRKWIGYADTHWMMLWRLVRLSTGDSEPLPFRIIKSCSYVESWVSSEGSGSVLRRFAGLSSSLLFNSRKVLRTGTDSSESWRFEKLPVSFSQSSLRRSATSIGQSSGEVQRHKASFVTLEERAKINRVLSDTYLQVFMKM